MSKGKSPAFQFYPSDFLSDENVVLMNNIEVGCYIKLLCFCWKQGSIPSDVSKIAKLCNEPDDKMVELWSSIKPCFRNGQPDRLIHPRLEVERKKQANFSKERSESGKRGAEKRWKNKDKDGSAIEKPIAKNGSLSSSSSLTKKKGIIYSKEFLKFYSAYPLKKSKKPAFESWKKYQPDLDICLTAIKNQKAERIRIKNQGGFLPEWKHPSTWLNNNCWEDSTEEIKGDSAGF